MIFDVLVGFIEPSVDFAAIVTVFIALFQEIDVDKPVLYIPGKCSSENKD